MNRLLAAYLGLLAVFLAVSGAGAVVVLDSTGPDDAVEAAVDGRTYNFLTWEIENVTDKWVYKLRHLFDSRSAEEEERAIERYFAITAEIAALGDQPENAERASEAERERQELEAEVEDILEGRMTAVLEDEGVTLSPPPFTELDAVLPPVDFELDAPPRVLAISHRDRLALDRSFILEPNLALPDYEDIEQKAESDNEGTGGVSALVVGTSGVATYPSVVSAYREYRDLVETAFHEWLHQYLVFFPLGRGYFASSETRTLNESVASLAGRELARVYFERYPEGSAPSPESPPGAAGVNPARDPEFNFTEEMRTLRREVESLLAERKVAEAEALMNEKRDEFEAKGHYLRRLNQAYFAFYGFYADSPGSIDPIGLKLHSLLELTASPGEFIRAMRGITTRAELDRVLAEAGG